MILVKYAKFVKVSGVCSKIFRSSGDMIIHQDVVEATFHSEGHVFALLTNEHKYFKGTPRR